MFNTFTRFSLMAVASAATFFSSLTTPLEAADVPQYRIEAKTFNSGEADIRKVLDYAARPLWDNFPGYKIEPIVVTKGNSGPIVLYKRNAKKEIIVKLDTTGTFWCQYAYQWSHELCHVLCGFRNDGRENKWFEETICEMASQFSMRAMAKDWEKKPPYPNWKGYEKSIQSYVDDVIAKYEKIEIRELGKFYQKHKTELRKSSTLRKLNGAMAAAMLPVFEKNPSHWEAVRYLNVTPAKPGISFKQYLAKWKKDAPKKHHALIDGIARAYGQTR